VDIYKIYAESFRGEDHLLRILEAAQAIISGAFASGTPIIRHHTNLGMEK